jgi:hypothetical protein
MTVRRVMTVTAVALAVGFGLTLLFQQYSDPAMQVLLDVMALCF